MGAWFTDVPRAGVGRLGVGRAGAWLTGVWREGLARFPGRQLEQPGRGIDDEPARGHIDVGHDRGHERDQQLAVRRTPGRAAGCQDGASRAADGLGCPDPGLAEMAWQARAR